MTAFVTGNKTSSDAAKGPELYISDYAVLPPLLAQEGRRLPRVLWEPSCGNGALVLPLRRLRYEVTATDLHDWGCPDSSGDVDFFSDIASRYLPVTNIGTRIGIVSNPPFGPVEEYIERATRMAPYTALLLRFSFLESGGRFRWWNSVGLQRVHLIIDRVPMMHRHGWQGPRLEQSGLAFAWFIFETGKRPRKSFPVHMVIWKEAARLYPEMPGDRPAAAKSQIGLFDSEETGR
jgi:hypothetical protein